MSVIGNKIKFGFSVNYLCPGCGEQINAYYHYFNFAMIKKKMYYNTIKCPLCMIPIEIDLTGCDRPFPNCILMLTDYTSSKDGIGSMVIEKTFIVK